MALPAGRYGVTKRQLNKIKNLPVNTIGMIEEALETSEEYTDDAIGWRSVNKLNADALFATISHHGISLSISNQIVSLIGTVSSDVGYYFGDVNKTLMLPAGTYTFSIVVSGNFGTASEIRLCKRSDSSRIVGIFTNDIKPVSFTLDTDTEVFIAIVNSNVSIGTSVNATLKLQLEKGSKATPYEPYHASVSDSLAEKADITALGTQEDATASKLYHVGEHFYKDGKFCTVIGLVDVALGTTWTLNTNYIEGVLGDVIYRKYAKTVTLSANVQVAINIPSISGYTPIQVTSAATGTGTYGYFDPVVYQDSSLFAQVVIRNKDSVNEHTWDILIGVIYVKSGSVPVQIIS